ncbi:nucleoside 2-deoxyribosyltransferase [Erysipelothrix rhusiopathiae]|uniref:Nucleoside 2-deoxyribosyltransferase n=1 Tax=Erysipelothrix piscisicarius TaxID=2485784 RepID=A0A3S8RMJ0_9FIRM|nr:nucleoside 2-deoxyribosyltransferase [Erysipelothrix piscisicarius]AZK44107.1 nucleoside 2-deoxyribosyltransferase [Erysipelothrix piscisicarius]NBA01750.1 nucleoside 2-deoxyribosyltransferase [Erysipelothrix rhusiopathiae]
MKKIYFASPLFTHMEFRYNAEVVAQIRSVYPNVEVYLPQEQMEINDKNSYANSMMIAQADTDALLKSDLIVAVLDGQTIDAGVASEVGVAYQANIPMIGLYTDSRQQGADNAEKINALREVAESQFSYVNLYTVGLIKLKGTVVTDEQTLIELIGEILGQ